MMQYFFGYIQGFFKIYIDMNSFISGITIKEYKSTHVDHVTGLHVQLWFTSSDTH